MFQLLLSSITKGRIVLCVSVFLKGKFINFFIGSYDAPKYEITWTENVDVTDCLIPDTYIDVERASKRYHFTRLQSVLS